MGEYRDLIGSNQVRRTGRAVLYASIVVIAGAAFFLFARTNRLSNGASFQPPLMTQSKSTGELERGSVKIVSFLRNGSIYVRNLVTVEEKIALEKHVVTINGDGEELRVNYRPALSPSGDAIAFYYRSSLADTRGTIKIVSLETHEIHGFQNLSTISASEPEWSPDGRMLAFKLSKGMILHVGLLDVVSGEWRDITKTSEFNGDFGVWLDSWAPDGKSIICHNSQFLYRIDVNGSILLRLPIESFYDGSLVSTSTRFSLTADDKRLLFEAGDPDDPAILIYDLSAKKLSRVTPKEVGGMEARWLPGEKEILFTCFDKKKRPKTFNICQISDDGKDLKQLIENGRFASYSTK